MNKKLVAIFVAILMIVGMIPALSVLPSANAQSVPSTIPCDPAIASNHPFCVYLHPGADDTYKAGWSQTLDTLWGTQASADGKPHYVQPGNTQTAQLFNNYLNYAILASATGTTSSVGDLQFDITVLDQISAIELWVPPEFKFTAPTKEESVWTDLTNDYQYIWLLTATPYDPVAPGWTRVLIGIENYWGDGPMPASQIGSVIQNTAQAAATQTINPGIYHIRLFNLAAPSIAGLYHFKIYYFTGALKSDVNNPLYWDNYKSIGEGNFPIMIVKSELNPAWDIVTVRTGLYFAPPLVSGYVLANGTTPAGMSVQAMGYWGPNDFAGNVFTPDVTGNGGAQYVVALFGLAEGTYAVTTYASGAVPSTSSRFSVMAGQSYHMSTYVFDSPDLFTTVYSKHGTGELPWGNLWQLPGGTNNPYAAPCDDLTAACPRRDILLELYDSNNKLVSFWASNTLSQRKWFSWSNRIGWTGTLDANGWPVFGGSPLVPSQTSYSRHLVDNYDLLYNARGYPSTQLDGHVPWSTADYVSGIANGAYTLEAYVTGYVMDQADAYQRSFIVSGIDRTVPFDLRRSNWIEVQMHMPTGTVLSDITTVLLTATDANGGERAAAAFWAPKGAPGPAQANTICAPVGICNVVLEGKNGIFPNIGGSVGRGTGPARKPTEKDYGLNPTASTHSAGAVALAGNPYTIHLYMADMGQPWIGEEGTGWYTIVGGNPQTSVFLCNSAQMLSFSIVPSWLEITLRSVDFEVPAHSRPWTFPGSEIWVEFVDSNGTTQDILDPTVYGLFQDAGMTNAGWKIAGRIYDGNNCYGVTPYDSDTTTNVCGAHEQLTLRYAGTDSGSPNSMNTYGNLYRVLPAGAWRPTGLPIGPYTVNVHTHGYVQRNSFGVQLSPGGGADIAADLIQGAQIRVVMDFKNEGIKGPFTGFVRTEVFNAAGDLVGANIYGVAEPNKFTNNLNGGAYFTLSDPYWSWIIDGYHGNAMKVPGPAQAAGFGQPSSLYPSTPSIFDQYPNGYIGTDGQRAMFSSIYYGAPACPDELNTGQCQVWASWDYMTPIDANKFGTTQVPDTAPDSFGPGTDTVVADVYGFYWYAGDAARTWAGGWPTTNGLSNSGKQVGGEGFAWDSGLRGSADLPNWAGSGGGQYSIKIYAFDYDRQRMYEMGWPLTGITLPWGGAQDFFVDMDSLATLKGTVSWMDMFGNYRALPWAQITASPGPDSNTAVTGLSTSTASGTPDYVMWLPAGSHDVSVGTSQAPQVWGGPNQQNSAYTVVVQSGSVAGGETRLDHSAGVPVPELPVYVVPFGLLAVLGASVWLLRKRNLNTTPVLMK